MCGVMVHVSLDLIRCQLGGTEPCREDVAVVIPVVILVLGFVVPVCDSVDWLTALPVVPVWLVLAVLAACRPAAVRGGVVWRGTVGTEMGLSWRSPLVLALG